MMRNLYFRLALIILIIAVSLWVDVNNQIKVVNPFNDKVLFERNVSTRLGRDVRGGLQVILEPDLPEGTVLEEGQLDTARVILENRTNALGVAESSIQVAGENRLVGEFPGVESSDRDRVLETLQQTGLLEFVDFGTTSLPEGMEIKTDFAGAGEGEEGETIYHTVMTGRALKTVGVTIYQLTNKPVITFELTAEGKDIFAEYTSTHVGQILGIVLDKRVISSPRINEAITEGSGIIEGNFTVESANALAIQLRYGSLPVPLKIVDTRYIGPVLGEDSLQKSLMAGLIGMFVVVLFMSLYYRLPGLVAVISIFVYAAMAFAVFKLIPVTLTLPGIAGFLLSTGSALDANILVFERLKEELRGGLNLLSATEKAWKRAWSSIRDSNIATLITSAILFWFGSTFGATMVKGFSLTLAFGVVMSLIAALFVTRTLLALALRWFKPTNLARWFGI